MNLLPMGDSAWLLEAADAQQAQRWRATLVAAAWSGVLELVPGHCSLLVSFDPLAIDGDEIKARLLRLSDTPLKTAESRQHEISVRYDGEDLAAVAAATGLSTAEVIHRHVQGNYFVAFLGFAPGFAYLTGLDAALCLPRRPKPRTRVPAGSVALADSFTAIYPQATPGGWHLIGHCDVKLFDPERERPALLAPGDRVRFREFR